MKEELIALQPVLVAKNKEVGEMQVVVEGQKGDADKVAAVRLRCLKASNALKPCKFLRILHGFLDPSI